jgi:hypothetical protein
VDARVVRDHAKFAIPRTVGYHPPPITELLVKFREIVPCQTCNRDIENLSEGLVVWCTTKDKPGAPSIKVVHAVRCDPWKGAAPHSLVLSEFQEKPVEMRKLWATTVKEGGIAAVMAWEVLGKIYEGISEKDFFRVEEPATATQVPGGASTKP